MNDSFSDVSNNLYLDLGRYARAARRQWFAVLVMTLAGGALGWWQFTDATQHYQATATVEVGAGLVDLTDDPSMQAASSNIETQRQVAKSVRVFASAAGDIPGDWTVNEVQQSTEVAAPPDSSTMLMTFEGNTPSQARTGARVWAQTYLDDRATHLTAALQSSRESLVERSNALEARLTDARRAQAATVSGAPQAQEALAAVRTLGRRTQTIQRQIDSLDSMRVDPGSILGEPQIPLQAAGSPGFVFLGGGSLAGLVLGLAFALVIERKTDRIRDARDLRRVTDVPVWTSIPRMSESSGHAVDLAHDAMATRLLLAMRHSGLRTVLVTSAEANVSGVVGRLADRLRRLGETVRVTDDIEELLQRTVSPGILVLDAPAVLADPRTAVLSVEADACLIVVRVRRTRASWLSTAIESLQSSNGTVSGIVMDRGDPGGDPNQNMTQPPVNVAEHHPVRMPESVATPEASERRGIATREGNRL